MKMMAGRVVVVTGAASGLGLALAGRFGAEGCRVVLADIEEEPLQDAVAKMASDGVECIGAVTDVSDPAAVARLADRAVGRFDAVHILCNNAGVSARRPIADLGLEDYQWVLGVVLWGCIHGVHAFLPILREQDEAHIVNVSSMSGLLAFPLGGPYNAAKAGVISLSETLYHELRMLQSPVGVSVVCPGGLKTRFLSSARNRPGGPAGGVAPIDPVFASMDEQATRLIDGTGTAPEEVAEMVVDAVKHDRFYVLSHQEAYEEALRNRLADILAGRPPSTIQLPSPGSN